MKIINFIICMGLLSCTTFKTAKINNNESLKYIKANLEFLASDELEGRETTKRGSKIAGKFIANQLQQYGIQPYGDDGTYFQNFKLQNTIFLNSSKLVLTGKEKIPLKFGENFIPFQSGDLLDLSEIVYVGYGISDSSLQYDDYADIDVKGKTVLCMFGIPTRKDDPDYFKEGQRWRSSSRKAKTAREKGAKAIIIIQSEFWIKNWQSLGTRYINGMIGKIDPGLPINAVWIDSLTIKNLLALQHLTHHQIRDTLNSGYLKTGTILNAKLSCSIDKSVDTVMARNIIGYVKGTTAATSNFIVAGAHYDHQGMRDNEIYNGADDNASGTTALLEAARLLAIDRSNKKPVLFCFWDAEEKGLIGSEYFAENWEDKDNIQVYINMDMVGREHPDTIFTYGAKYYSPELQNIVDKTNVTLNTFVFDYSFDDPNHEQRPYFRSDHWSFGKHQIPFVAFSDKHNAYEANDYHKPTDTSEKIEYLKIEKVSQLTHQLVLKLANLDHPLEKIIGEDNK